MSEYRNQLEAWLAKLDVQAGTVLDIGAGDNPVRNRAGSWNVGAYWEMGLPEYDVENYSHHVSIEEGFDIVFCLEVMEYVIHPVRAMEKIRYELTNGGIAYVTFPFVYPHHNQLERDSLRYTEPGIRRLAEHAGLDINQIWYRRDKSGLLNEFYAADGMRKAKEYENHDVTGLIVEFGK